MKVVLRNLILLLICGIFINAHPLKMAYTAVKYNNEKQIFEVAHRVFQDDFEATLKSAYNYPGDDVFVNQKSSSTINSVTNFFNKNFSIAFNQQKQKLKFIKIEQKNQMGIVVWFETTGKISNTDLKTVSVYDFIMMESFSDQVNMFNLNIDGNKRTIVFDIYNTKETLSLE